MGGVKKRESPRSKLGSVCDEDYFPFAAVSLTAKTTLVL